MKNLFDNIPPIFKNFYFSSFIVFLTWVLIFDRNDIVTHIRLKRELNKAEEQRGFYSDKIVEVEKSRKELEDNRGLLEKYAREKYFMKKESEDVYIVEKDKEVESE